MHASAVRIHFREPDAVCINASALPPPLRCIRFRVDTDPRVLRLQQPCTPERLRAPFVRSAVEDVPLRCSNESVLSRIFRGLQGRLVQLDLGEMGEAGGDRGQP